MHHSQVEFKQLTSNSNLCFLEGERP